MKKLFILVALLATANLAYGQEQQAGYEESADYEHTQSAEAWLELARADIQADKIAIITANMGMTAEESEIFWPIYREYEGERAKLWDQTWAVIKAYADNYEALTDDKAAELMGKAFEIDQAELTLLKTYHDRVSGALSPTLAARFAQIENQLNRVVDLQISTQLPLVPRATN